MTKFELVTEGGKEVIGLSTDGADLTGTFSEEPVSF